MKDVFPDRCGQEPYTYEGNGQGQGGGGVYTDVDLSKFSVERAAEAEKIGEDPMEWAVKDTTVLAALQVIVTLPICAPPSVHAIQVVRTHRMKKPCTVAGSTQRADSLAFV